MGVHKFTEMSLSSTLQPGIRRSSECVCAHTHTLMLTCILAQTHMHTHTYTCAHSTLCLPLSLSLFLLVTTSLLFSIGFLGRLSHNTHLGRLKQGKSVISHFWRTEVPTQGGGGQDSLQRTMREDLLRALVPVLSLAIFPSVAILPSLPTRFCPHFLFYADSPTGLGPVTLT